MDSKIPEPVDILFLLPSANQKLTMAYKSLHKQLEKSDIQMTFVDFHSSRCPTNILDAPILSVTDYDFSRYDILQEAERLEDKYDCTISRLNYPYSSQKKREYDFQYNLVSDLEETIFDFLFLEKITQSYTPKLILRNQGTQSTFYFADKIATYNNIQQATYSYEFFGRMVFYKRLYGENVQLHPVEFNPQMSEGETIKFLREQIYDLNNDPHNTVFDDIIKYILDNYQHPKQLFNITPEGIRSLKRKMGLKTPQGYYKFKNVLKSTLYQQPSNGDKYTILTLHKPLESNEIHRSHPYIEPGYIVGILSRNLPAEYDIYVREHPHHQSMFGYPLLNKLRQYPNVHIVDPAVEITDLIDNANFVTVFNNTTGYESLFLETPVLALSPSPYSSHNNTKYVNNLFNIDGKLAQVSTHCFDEDSMIKFMTTMMRRSIDVPMGTRINNIHNPESVGQEFASFVSLLYTKLT